MYKKFIALFSFSLSCLLPVHATTLPESKEEGSVLIIGEERLLAPFDLLLPSKENEKKRGGKKKDATFQFDVVRANRKEGSNYTLTQEDIDNIKGLARPYHAIGFLIPAVDIVKPTAEEKFAIVHDLLLETFPDFTAQDHSKHVYLFFEKPEEDKKMQTIPFFKKFFPETLDIEKEGEVSALLKAIHQTIPKTTRKTTSSSQPPACQAFINHSSAKTTKRQDIANSLRTIEKTIPSILFPSHTPKHIDVRDTEQEPEEAEHEKHHGDTVSDPSVTSTGSTLAEEPQAKSLKSSQETPFSSVENLAKSTAPATKSGQEIKKTSFTTFFTFQNICIAAPVIGICIAIITANHYYEKKDKTIKKTIPIQSTKNKRDVQKQSPTPLNALKATPKIGESPAPQSQTKAKSMGISFSGVNPWLLFSAFAFILAPIIYLLFKKRTR